MDNVEKYTLEKSLSLYEEYLREKLQDKKVLERFLKLKNANSLGCYCGPTSKCHTDIILKILREYFPNTSIVLPKRNCLKVTQLRPTYDNLKEWCETDGNVRCTRQGRVWITYKMKGEPDEKEIYHYGCSEWSNPYKVK